MADQRDATSVAVPGRRFGVHLSVVGLANLADGVVQTGVPLIAITLTRSPLLIGVLTAAVWLPWLLFGPLAGVFVDRWDRRRTMLIALGARAALLAAAAVVAATGRLTIGVLVALALAYGITEVFTDLAAQAQVPALVGRDPGRLRAANSRLAAVEALTNSFAGPPIAGFLVAASVAWVLGAPAAVVALAVLVLLTGLRGPFVAGRPDPGAAVPSVRAELVDGMTTLWRHPVLRPLLLAGGAWNFASTAFSAVGVLWLVGPGSAGGFTAQVYSLTLVALPAGAIVGSLIAEGLLARLSEIRVMVTCWGVNAVSTLLVLVWPTVPGVVAFLLVAGVAGTIGNVVTTSLRPRLIPDRQLGKVSGASRAVGYGAMPLGALLGGWAAQVFGIPAVLVGVAVVFGLATVGVAMRVNQPLVDAHLLPAPRPAVDPA